MSTTKEHRISVINSVMDNIATLGVLSNPRGKMLAFEQVKKELETYPKEQKGISKVERIADIYTQQAYGFCELYQLEATNLDSALMSILMLTEKALTQLVEA